MLTFLSPYQSLLCLMYLFYKPYTAYINKPIIIQRTNNSADNAADSPFAIIIENAISPPQHSIPNIGNHGQNGTLKGLSLSGSVFLNIKIATQTMANDINVPKLQSDAATFKSRTSVPKTPTIPTVIVSMCGVLNFG